MEGDLYTKLTVDGKFAIRSLGSVNVLKAALDFEAAMREIESMRCEMDDWNTCSECKRKVWRTIGGKCEECLGIVSPLFSPPIPLSETYLDILTGVRLEVKRDAPGQAVFSLFWSEDGDNLDEINAAIQRLMAYAGITPPKTDVK